MGHPIAIGVAVIVVILIAGLVGYAVYHYEMTHPTCKYGGTYPYCNSSGASVTQSPYVKVTYTPFWFIASPYNTQNNSYLVLNVTVSVHGYSSLSINTGDFKVTINGVDYNNLVTSVATTFVRNDSDWSTGVPLGHLGFTDLPFARIADGNSLSGAVVFQLAVHAYKATFTLGDYWVLLDPNGNPTDAPITVHWLQE